jgi:hypothetical protein
MLTTIPYVVVPGTGAWADTWYRPPSPWYEMMKSAGFEPVSSGGRPFVWTTNVTGYKFWRRWFGSRFLTDQHRDWEAGGVNLYAWVVPPLAPQLRVPPLETHVIAHSHGLQVALYACSHGLKIQTLISIGSPIRHDMAEVARLARPNIRFWLHIYSDDSDRWQWFGEVGDGALGIVRESPFADVNQCVPRSGHSKILNDPTWFHVWPQWQEMIRGYHGLTE